MLKRTFPNLAKWFICLQWGISTGTLFAHLHFFPQQTPPVSCCWYIQAASVAGIQVSLVLPPCSFVWTTPLTFYFLQSSLKSNYLHQLDFYIPSSIVRIQSFQQHWENISLPLGNILKYWGETMQEVIATIFIFFYMTTYQYHKYQTVELFLNIWKNAF